MSSVSPTGSSTAADQTPPAEDKSSEFSQKAQGAPEAQSNEGHVASTSDTDTP